MTDVVVTELEFDARSWPSTDRWTLAARKAARVLASRAIRIGVRYGLALLLMGGGEVLAVAVAWQG